MKKTLLALSLLGCLLFALGSCTPQEKEEGSTKAPVQSSTVAVTEEGEEQEQVTSATTKWDFVVDEETGFSELRPMH